MAGGGFSRAGYVVGTPLFFTNRGVHCTSSVQCHAPETFATFLFLFFGSRCKNCAAVLKQHGRDG